MSDGVVEVPSPHRLVRASAGTGKTYRLTVELLARAMAGSEAEAMLAVTFTRKAAGEVLERVLTRLALAARDQVDAERLAGAVGAPGFGRPEFRLLLARLCRSLHRLQVGTIDSFFYRLVRSFRLELSVPGAVALLGSDDPRVASLRSQALDSVLEALGDRDFPLLLALLHRLQEGRAGRSVTAELDRLLVELHEAFRQTPDPAVWRRLPVPEGRLSSDALKRAGQRLDDVTRTTVRSLRRALRQSLDDIDAERWEAFLGRGPAKALAEGVGSFNGRAIPASVRSALEPLIAHARAVLLQAAREQTEATYLLLHHFADRFEELRRRERILLFEDLPYKLARELPALDADRLLEVFYRLDARVSHLLVDEFQDTSLEQWRVMRPLVDEILAYADGSRTFFCVGDPKQAIYGWRGGCAELFGEVEELLGQEPGSAEVQRTSYRTAPVVLEVVDRIFAELSRNPVLANETETVEEWLASYVALLSHEPQRDGFVELVTSGRKGGEEATAHDRITAELVKRLTGQAPGRTIGVLVQTNAAVRRLLDLLRRLGVEASGEGGGPILDDGAVLAVLSALVLADHPADTVAAFHVSRTPLAGLVGLESWRAPRAGGGPAAERAAQRAAARIREGLAVRGVAELLAQWAHALRPDLTARSRLRLEQLVELADRWEPRASLRPAEFVEMVASSAVEEPSSALVRVMTVHKAKGLEFDIAVLAELERTMLRTRDRILWVDRPTPTSPPRAIHRAVRSVVRHSSPELEEAYRQECRRQLWDGLSGLYVAVTRARSALHLVVPPLGRRADGRPRWGAPSWATVVLQALAGDAGSAVCEEGQRLFSAGAECWASTTAAAETALAEPTERRFTAMRREARPPSLALVRPSSAAAAARRLAVRDVLRLEGEEPRRRGVLLHAWLREVGWLDDGLPDDETLERVAHSVAPWATARWLAQRREELRRILAWPAIRRVFSRPPQTAPGEQLELWRERAFAQVHEGRLIHGVFDRVVVVERRGAVIGAELWELKTDAAASRDAVERGASDVDQAVERYRPQLETYRTALAAMLGLLPTAVRSSLVFLLPGVVREV